jgi:hypothetical protein
MEITRDERSPFGRQLAAYGEFWKRDHHAAMKCRDWEETIAFGLSLYSFHQEREHLWREQVFRGTIPFSAQDDETYQTQLKGWLEVADEFLRDRLPELERDFGVVEGAAQLRGTAADARIHLEAWSPPRISQAIGLRDMTLSPQSAAEVDRVMAEAPKPVPAGPVPRTISAEEFRRVHSKG